LHVVEVGVLFAKCHFKVEEALGGKFLALTCDHWTSVAKESFLALTGHWIDENWVLRSGAMACARHYGKSTAEDVCQEVKDQFALYERLRFDHVAGLVSDTAGNMCAMGNLFMTPGDDYVAWFGCFAHILELTTGHAFDDANLPGCDEVMKKCRAMCTFFDKSTQALDHLKDIQRNNNIRIPVGVVQDVVTRWWSTLAMLERLLRLRTYIQMGVQAVPQLWRHDKTLTDAQWVIVTHVVEVLKPFMAAQRMMEGQSYVTISLVPFMVDKIRKKLRSTAFEHDDMSIRHLGRKLFDDFIVRWGDSAADSVFDMHLSLGPMRRPQGLPLKTMLAAVVDPRTTHMPFLCPDDRAKIKAALKTHMLQHMQKFGGDAVAPGVGGAADGGDGDDNHGDNGGGDKNGNGSDEEDFFAGINAEPPNVLPPDVGPVLLEDRVDAELDSFYAEIPLPIMQPTAPGAKAVFNNPLLWWQEHEKKYPILSQVTKTLLCIPATSAPSERLFSSAGLTIANNRARLAGDNAARLIFLHDAIPLLDALLD